MDRRDHHRDAAQNRPGHQGAGRDENHRDRDAGPDENHRGRGGCPDPSDGHRAAAGSDDRLETTDDRHRAAAGSDDLRATTDVQVASREGPVATVRRLVAGWDETRAGKEAE